MMFRFLLLPFILTASLTLSLRANDASDALLRQSGVTGGIAVFLAPNALDPVTGLAEDGRFVVEILRDAPSAVASDRAALAAAGVFPLANSQLRLDRSRLPYADHLVNLLVADLDATPVPDAEVRRILTYDGAAVVRKGGTWTVIRGTTPDDVDEWSHALRGPDRRPVSTDRKIQPFMNGLKWMADDYKWIGQNASGLRIADHNIYYVKRDSGAGWIVDESGKRTYDNTPRYYVVSRDAQNGVIKWIRKVDWMPVYNGNSGREDSMEYSHWFAAGNKKLYTYPTAGGYLTALDGDTGEVVKVYDQTAKLEAGKGAEPDFFGRGKGFTSFREPGDLMRSSVMVLGDKLVQVYDRDIRVIDEASGRVLAHHRAEAPLGQALVGEDGHLYVVDGKTALSFTVPDLKPRWSTPLPIQGPVHGLTGPLNGCLPIHLRGGKHGTENMGLVMLNTADGAVRWSTKRVGGSHAVMLKDRLTVDGWQNSSDYNPMTGEEIEGHGISGDMAGCSYPTYTPDYYIRGLTLHSRENPEIAWVGDGARPDCQVPTYPAYGHLYIFGAKCGCSTFLRSGLAAFSSTAKLEPLPQEPRLLTRPGIRALPPGNVRELKVDSQVVSDWNRGQSFIRGHKGFNLKTVPDSVQNLSAQFNNSFYDPKDKVRKVKADAGVVETEFNQNQLTLRNGNDIVWTLPLGGRVLLDPVLWQDLAVVGTADGWVTAVDQASGEVRWAYQAAPSERRMMAVGQLESAWPVSALTLWRDQLLVAAGRRDSFDDGIFVTALEAGTGKPLWTETIARERLRLEKHETRLSLGYNGFGNKLSTLAGQWTVNDFDTSFWLIGTTPVSPQLRANPPQPARVSGLRPGLTYRYFELGEDRLKEAPDFDALAPVQQGITPAPTATLAEVPRTQGRGTSQYGIRYEGFLRIPEDGLRRLQLEAKGRARIWLDGKMVADYSDGQRSFGPLIPLKAGVYPLKVDFYTHGMRQFDGSMKLFWQSPDTEFSEAIAEAHFFHAP